MSNWEENEEIQRFREYLRIPSVLPDIDYEPCLVFLKRQAVDLGLPHKTYYPADPKKPVFIITWTGTEPNLPSIILNSHMDVVPVFEQYWTHAPFGADIDKDGRIYARGAQDMKSVGMQYMAAIRSLKKNRVTFKRTIHITFVPDEEINGILGMAKFVHTPEFKALNVGFSLDEGDATPNDVCPVYYAERAIWEPNFKINGTPGHGALLLENTVGAKLRYIMDKMYFFRAQEFQKLKNNTQLTIGDVTTVNLTEINGGIQTNVIPPVLEAGFDVRLAIDVDQDEFENQLRKWCSEVGGNIEIEFRQKESTIQPTKIDSTNPFWLAFKSAVDELGVKIKTQVCAGGTDSRYIRDVGIPALGFSPMRNTPDLAHDHDEYLSADIYLEGIEIYKNIIPKLANA